MLFQPKGLVVLSPFVSREFPALPGSRFDILPASVGAYATAAEERLQREVGAGLGKAVRKAAVKSNNWTPKNPPPALREKLGQDAKITRQQIREWVLENEIDNLADPVQGKNSDVLLLVSGGLVPTAEGDVAYTQEVGRELLASEIRVSAEVAQECGEETGASVALGALWQAWVLRIAQDEANFSEGDSSPKG